MGNKTIKIIDETLREGMQYRGLMFSQRQRLKVLEFQEKLKIDICQAGYPPAHEHEADIIKSLNRHAEKNQYQLRIAGMGRANIHDAAILLDTQTDDLHFHLYIKNNTDQDQLETVFDNLSKTIDFVRQKNSRAVISIAMLDIGKTHINLLEKCILFLCDRLEINILSLPDTSGIMAPNHVFERIRALVPLAGNTRISIHCHNDMGMASANSIMGILAGGRILEASVLGIGERNGIADLYTTAKMLQNLGFDLNLNLDDISTFKAYYNYIDSIVYSQTRNHLLTDTFPVFGDAVKTHVAGTHADGDFGQALEEKFFLNVLCGKNLVKKYLDVHDINCPENILDALTRKIKSKSAVLNRSVNQQDLRDMVASLLN